MSKRQIKSRLKTLCEALRDAEKAGDAPRAFSIRSEIEYLNFMFRAA